MESLLGGERWSGLYGLSDVLLKPFGFELSEELGDICIGVSALGVRDL